jgi:predicted phage tail protein
MTFHDRDILGSGGGGGKSGSATEDKNTLQSKVTARALHLISEGEIEGLVDGDKSIYFDGTPLKARNGTTNIREVEYTERKGLPDQASIRGNKRVETPYSVEIQVTKDNGPVTQTISDANATSVRMVMRIPALVERKKDGSIVGANLHYQIFVRPYAGAYTKVIDQNIRDEKCTAPYQLDHEIELPAGGAPWDIKVERVTNDSDTDKVQNSLFWEAYYTCVEGRFTYPNSALIFTQMKADRVGSSMPQHTFHVRGLKVDVPTNYNPLTRAYTGIWDGSFKTAWTNNPVWIRRDLMVNDRYGLGEFLRNDQIDKWQLYTISQYCDELVPTGFKDENGNPTYEPRYTFNGVLNTREEAFKLLQDMAAVFRGMSYWAAGQVFTVADMPEDPVKLVTPANVIDGAFTYSGTAMKARHSVALVQWNDPDDGFRPAIEIVINEAMLQKYGWRERSVVTKGCASRGQAHRLGKWMLDSEQNETETVEYTASWDHVDIKPGDIIAIADPRKAGARTGGRLAGVTSKSVLDLDSVFTTTPGETYQLMVEMDDGSIETRTITGTAIVNNRSRLTVSPDFTLTPKANALWVITGTDVVPRNYRVLAINETESHLFRITALFHDPTKYARVEQGINLDPLPYTRFTAGLQAPINISSTEQQYLENGVAKSRITFSWSAGSPQLTAAYEVYVKPPNGNRISVLRHPSTTIDVDDVVPGTYTLEVAAISHAGLVSPMATYTHGAAGWAAIPGLSVDDLVLASNPGTTQFGGTSVTLSWKNNVPISNDPTATAFAPGQNPFYRRNTITVIDVVSGSLLRTEQVTAESYTYDLEKNSLDNAAQGRSPSRQLRFEIVVEDTLERTSAPATIEVSNPKPAAPTVNVAPGLNQLVISWTTSDDIDRVGSYVWVSTNASPYVPGVTLPVYEGPNSQFVFNGTPGTTYYVRVATYDAFDRSNLAISNPVSGVPIGLDGADTTPPAVPTGFTASGVGQMWPDGTFQGRITASWTANTEPDLAGYQIGLKKGSDAEVILDQGSTFFDTVAVPNAAYQVRVRALDVNGNKSAWTSVVNVTASVDTVAPAAPTGLVVTGGFDAIFVNWTPNTETDLSHYDLFFQTTSTPAPVSGTAPSWVSRSPNFVRANIGTGQTRYVWVRAVDKTGNKSAWTGPLSATTRQAIDQDIAAAAIGASQLADGAVVMDKIAANAITARHMVLTDLTNMVLNGDFSMGIEKWTLYGGTVHESAPGDALGRFRLKQGDRDAGFTDFITVRPGSTYYVAGTVYNTNAEDAIIHVNSYADDGTYINTIPVVSTSAKNAWTSIVAQVAVPSNAYKIRIVPTVNKPWGTNLTTYCYWTKFEVRRAYGANLIVDGAITANKMATGALEAKFATIGTAFITNAHILELNGSKITAETITGTQIQAFSIAGSRLSIGSMADNLVVNGDFEEGTTGWGSIGSNYSFYTQGGAQSGSICAVIDRTVAGANGSYWGRANSSNFPVEANAKYELTMSAWVTTATAQGIYLRAVWLDQNGNEVSYTDAYNNGPATGVWAKYGSTVQAPNNARYCRVDVFNWQSSASRYLVFDRVQMRKTVGTTLIEDDSITTGKMKVGSVTANIIGADQVQTQHMQAGSIHANRLTLGTVAPNLMAAGPGVNTLYNSEFRYSMARWGSFTNSGLALTVGRNLAGWTPAGGTMAYATLAGTPAVNTIFDLRNTNGGPYYPVIAGQRYEASAYLGAHRCTAYILLVFYDVNNTYLGEAAGNSITVPGGTSLATFGRSAVYTTAPANAVKVLVLARAVCTGAADPYLMVTRAYLGDAYPNQSQPSAWSPGPEDLDAAALAGQIVGVQIGDGVVAAEKIAANAVRAQHIQSDELESRHLKSDIIEGRHLKVDSIDTGVIKAGAVITDKISIGGVTTDRIGTNAVTFVGAVELAGTESGSINGFREVGEFIINRTANTKLIIWSTFNAESDETAENSKDLKLVRINQATSVQVNLEVKTHKVPFLRENAGGQRSYGGDMGQTFIDSENISGNHRYRVEMTWSGISNRKVVYMEVKR